MSNLNMNPQEGRLVQATEEPVANSMGNKVARPIETAKMAPGTMGNFQGEIDAARAQAQTAQQVNAMVQDTATRMVNLQVAEEESKKQLYEIDWHTKEREARQTAREQAISHGLDTDGEQAVYQMERDKRTSELKDKYTFTTKVGNDIEQRNQLWTDRANSDYVSNVVEPRRVDAVKGNLIRSLTDWSKQVTDQVAQDGDPVKGGELMKQTTAEMQAYLRQPQMVAVFGVAGVEDLAKKFVGEMQIDAVTTIANKNPDQAVSMLRNETGDPTTDPLHGMDSSVRRQALYTAEKELSARRADEARKLKEMQDKNEFELSYAITTNQVSGNTAVAQIKKMRDDNLIDQGHAEGLMTKVENRMERQARAAEAARARAEHAAEKQALLYQPVRDALETGLPLDPKNPSHVKSVDAYATALIAKDPKNASSTLLQLTQQTGVAPKVLRSQIYGLVNSKDPKEAVQGTQLLATVANVAPNVIHSMTDETVSKAHQIEMGVHPDQAQLNIERVRTMPKDQVEAYRKLADSKLDKINGAIKNTFGISKKDVGPEAYGAYREILRDQLVMTGGNMDAAITATNSLMRKSYGVSHLTGKPTLMFNAPEGANGATEWMNKQFKTDLSTIGLKPEQVQLKANTQGTYDLVAVNEQGVATGYVVDSKTGRRQTWEPDHESAAKQQRDADIATAAKKREEYLNPTGMNKWIKDRQQQVGELIDSAQPKAPSVTVMQSDIGGFAPRGAKASAPVNTGTPTFGKFKDENK